MKEKRIDILLAKAGFWQLLFMAVAGAAVAELLKGSDADMMMVFVSAACTLCFGLITYNQYKKASRLARKTKRI